MYFTLYLVSTLYRHRLVQWSNVYQRLVDYLTNSDRQLKNKQYYFNEYLNNYICGNKRLISPVLALKLLKFTLVIRASNPKNLLARPHPYLPDFFCRLIDITFNCIIFTFAVVQISLKFLARRTTKIHTRLFLISCERRWRERTIFRNLFLFKENMLCLNSRFWPAGVLKEDIHTTKRTVDYTRQDLSYEPIPRSLRPYVTKKQPGKAQVSKKPLILDFFFAKFGNIRWSNLARG